MVCKKYPYLKGNYDFVLKTQNPFFEEGITWSDVGTGDFACRYTENGYMFDVKGSSMFPSKENLKFFIGFLNSKFVSHLMYILNPTMSFQIGNIKSLPVIIEGAKNDKFNEIVTECIRISKKDWDSYETSWDFRVHPLMEKNTLLEKSFDMFQTECDDRFKQLKKNEEEINRMIIDLYGLEDELTPEVEDKEVTVRKADLQRDIKSLISYAVGCMFGRYSLDVEGLVYAGGNWDKSQYKTYSADVDNIITICDDKDYEDDIVGQFIQFVEIVYGKETLDENLRFIADALGGKGHPKEVIRNYFFNDFVVDHYKNYQKRPIYWLFDSGKKGGFKALIYMHRYQPDTLARIRTDYVHKQQARYRTEIEAIEIQINSETSVNKVKLSKKLNSLRDQLGEITIYEEKIHHLADQMIEIDFEDGVTHNYEIFKDILAKIK